MSLDKEAGRKVEWRNVISTYKMYHAGIIILNNNMRDFIFLFKRRRIRKPASPSLTGAWRKRGTSLLFFIEELSN